MSIPLLGFPEESIMSAGTYICRPVPGLVLIAFEQTGVAGYWLASIESDRPDLTPVRVWFEGDVPSYSHAAESLIQVLALMHHLIATFGGNQCPSLPASPIQCQPLSAPTSRRSLTTTSPNR